MLYHHFVFMGQPPNCTSNDFHNEPQLPLNHMCTYAQSYERENCSRCGKVEGQIQAYNVTFLSMKITAVGHSWHSTSLTVQDHAGQHVVLVNRATTSSQQMFFCKKDSWEYRQILWLPRSSHVWHTETPDIRYWTRTWLHDLYIFTNVYSLHWTPSKTFWHDAG